MRRFFISLLIASCLFVNILPALAVDSAVATNSSTNQDLSQTLQSYKNSRSALNKLRQKLGLEADEDKNAEYLTNRKQFLTASLNGMIKYLTSLKEKITTLPNIDETDRTAALQSVDSYIQRLNSYNARIETITNKADLLLIVKDIRSTWQEARINDRLIIIKLFSSRLNKIATEIQSNIPLIEQKITTLKQQNKDTTRADSLLVEVKAQLTDFSNKQTILSNKLKAINVHDANPSVLQESLVSLKDIRQAITSINQKINNINSELERLFPE